MFDVELITSVDEALIDTIVRVDRESFPEGWEHENPKEYFSDKLNNANNVTLILKKNGVIVGYLIAVPHNDAVKELREDDPLVQEDETRFYIESIAILPSYQGKGGFALMFNTLSEELRKKGIQKISLHARISMGLSSAIQKRTNVTKIRRIENWKFYNSKEPADYIEADLFRLKDEKKAPNAD